MKPHVIATLCIALTCAAGSATASSIGVFFSPDGSDCDANVTEPSGLFRWYICAILTGDAAANGITGAEFRQTGTPEGWTTILQGSPAANVTLGSALGGGCNIAFPSCQPGSNGVVLLYTVDAYPDHIPGETYLSILSRDPPINANFPCPLVTLCDPPEYTILCVQGGQAILNGASCSVGVETTTWSRVKSLYGR